jgi:hypothetical protein
MPTLKKWAEYKVLLMYAHPRLEGWESNITMFLLGDRGRVEEDDAKIGKESYTQKYVEESRRDVVI